MLGQDWVSECVGWVVLSGRWFRQCISAGWQCQEMVQGGIRAGFWLVRGWRPFSHGIRLIRYAWLRQVIRQTIEDWGLSRWGVSSVASRQCCTKRGSEIVSSLACLGHSYYNSTCGRFRTIVSVCWQVWQDITKQYCPTQQMPQCSTPEVLLYFRLCGPYNVALFWNGEVQCLGEPYATSL